VPTYQYACTECEHQLEAVQKFTDDALTECPACTGRLRKVFSAVGVVFKGSGFYRTDSRGKSSSGENGSDSKPAAKTSSDSSSTATPAKSESGAGKDSGGSKDSGSTKKSSGESAA
jgi:putative FmdB family regulatory protein